MPRAFIWESLRASALNKSSVPRPRLQPRSSFGSGPPQRRRRRCCLSSSSSGDVDAVEVVGAEGTVALGALPLAGVVAHLEALVAEDVEALGEHRLLVPHVAAGAAQLGLAKSKTHTVNRELPEHPRHFRRNGTTTQSTGGRAGL